MHVDWRNMARYVYLCITEFLCDFWQVRNYQWSGQTKGAWLSVPQVAKGTWVTDPHLLTHSATRWAAKVIGVLSFRLGKKYAPTFDKNHSFEQCPENNSQIICPNFYLAHLNDSYRTHQPLNENPLHMVCVFWVSAPLEYRIANLFLIYLLWR